MYQNLLRLYTIVCLWMLRLQLWAQEEGGDDLSLSRRGVDEEMLYSEEMLDYQPFHIRFSDILMVIFLIVCCYVFGKIWKGCVYMILAFAAFMFFFIR
jgi:hypothetical protein